MHFVRVNDLIINLDRIIGYRLDHNPLPGLTLIVAKNEDILIGNPGEALAIWQYILTMLEKDLTNRAKMIEETSYAINND